MNFLIQSLAKTGMIKLERFKNSNNKKGYLYVITPKGIQEKSRITYEYFKRKTAEYEELKREIELLKKSVETAQAEDIDTIGSKKVKSISE